MSLSFHVRVLVGSERHGFSDQQRHEPAGKTEACVRNTTEDWKPWRRLPQIFPTAAKQGEGWRSNMSLFWSTEVNTPHSIMLKILQSLPSIWQMSSFPRAIWLWIRKLPRSRIHYYCQSYKPVTLGPWETWLTALLCEWHSGTVYWREGFYHGTPSFKSPERNVFHFKFQYSTNVSLLPLLVQEHQIFGCKIYIRTRSNSRQL